MAVLLRALETAPDQGTLFAVSLSRLLGWLYFAAWTASFWPQTLLIHRRRSVAGLSLDFMSLNVLGFACYTIFNLAFLLSETVQQQYRNSHNGQTNLVRWNDGFFALHGALIAAWQMAFSYVYKRAPGQRVSTWCRVLLSVMLAAIALAFGTCVVTGGHDGSVLRWIDFVNVCSYVKLVTTLSKYIPQCVLNARRRSTRGFAISGVTFDVTGGLLSLLQLFIDAQIINHDWSDVTGDPGKLGLSLISLAFDAVLLTQHYVLYGDALVEGEGEAPGEASLNEDDERSRLLQ